MNIPAAIRAHFKDWVSIVNFITEGSYGNRVMSSTAISIKGRLDYRTRRMTSVGGEEISSPMQLYLPDVAGMSERSEITLPDGTKPKIRAFARLKWPNGAYSIEVGYEHG